MSDFLTSYTFYTPCIMFRVTFYLPTINAHFPKANHFLTLTCSRIGLCHLQGVTIFFVTHQNDTITMCICILVLDGVFNIVYCTKLTWLPLTVTLQCVCSYAQVLTVRCSLFWCCIYHSSCFTSLFIYQKLMYMFCKLIKILYSFLWAIPWHLNFACWHFGTLCLFHLDGRRK